MDAYEKAVEHYGANRINAEFKNKGPVHAAIVASRIFEYAKNHIKIFTGNLNSEVADSTNYMKSLNRYINSGKLLQVILEELPAEEMQSNALKRVLGATKDPLLNVKVKVATPEFLASVKKSFSSGNLYHFMIADDSIYRVEIGKTEYKAICNFNDESITKRLAKTFNSFFEKEEE